MNAKNFTPHDVRLISADGTILSIPSVGVCRVQSTQNPIGGLHLKSGREVYAHGPTPEDQADIMSPPKFDRLGWVPGPPADGESVIVSIVAAPVVAERREDLTVYVPDTGPESAVRGPDGKIEAVRRLIRWHRPEPGPISLVECFNPANPFDGWAVFESYPYGFEGFANAVAEGCRKGGANNMALMIDIPTGMPFGLGGFAGLSEDATRERVAMIWEGRAGERERAGAA